MSTVLSTINAYLPSTMVVMMLGFTCGITPLAGAADSAADTNTCRAEVLKFKGLLRDCQVSAREEAHALAGLLGRFAQLRPLLQIPRKETRSDATIGPDTGCSTKITQADIGR